MGKTISHSLLTKRIRKVSEDFTIGERHKIELFLRRLVWEYRDGSYIDDIDGRELSDVICETLKEMDQ